MAGQKKTTVCIPRSAAEAGRPLDGGPELVRVAIHTPYVRSALSRYARSQIGFSELEKKIRDALKIHEAISNLYDAPDEVIRFLYVWLNLQPKPEGPHLYLAGLWQMARQRAWREADIPDVRRYVAAAVSREASRLSMDDEKIARNYDRRLEETFPDPYPDPHALSEAQSLLEHYRAISTPRERSILDLLDQGYSREEVEEELGITPACLRTHLSHLRNKN